MELSSFFNSIRTDGVGDRIYKAEDWAEYFASFIGNGVFPIPSTGLKVVQNIEGDMSVVLSIGKAWINGYFYRNTTELVIPLETADGVLNRIDRIVIRWDLSERTIKAKVKSSAYATSPVAPTLQRDADAYELCAADVWISNGATTILDADISDHRFNSALCGIATGVVQQIDFSSITAQFDSFFQLYQQLVESKFTDYNDVMSAHQADAQNTYNEYVAELDETKATYLEAMELWYSTFTGASEARFEAWMQTLQDMLDENTEANLLSLIMNLTDRTSLLEAVLFNDIDENPFVIQFDNLDGLEVTGIWNATLRRIEC